MSDLERKGKDATQCRKNQSDVFPKTIQARNARKRPRTVQGHQMWPASFHILSMFPDHTKPSERPHQYPGFVCTLLQEVKQFDYLGLRLGPMMTIKAAVASILEKANKGHSLALAVSYSLRYDKHHSNPTFCSSPAEILNLWKSCILPTSYSTSASSQTLHRFKRYRPPSTGHPTPHCMFMGTPQLYLLTLEFPPCTSHRTCSLHNSDSGCTPPSLTLFGIFYGNYGSPYYKLYPWTHWNTACRLQSVKWTSLGVTLPPLCLQT